MTRALALALVCFVVGALSGCGRVTTLAAGSLTGAWRAPTGDVSIEFTGSDESGVAAVSVLLASTTPSGCRAVLESSGSYAVSAGSLTARLPTGVLTQSGCDHPDDDLVAAMPGFTSYESAPFTVTASTLIIHTSTGDETYLRTPSPDAGIPMGDAGAPWH